MANTCTSIAYIILYYMYMYMYMYACVLDLNIYCESLFNQPLFVSVHLCIVLFPEWKKSLWWQKHCEIVIRCNYPTSSEFMTPSHQFDWSLHNSWWMLQMVNWPSYCSWTFVAGTRSCMYSGQNQSTNCFWLLNQLCTQGHCWLVK